MRKSLPTLVVYQMQQGAHVVWSVKYEMLYEMYEYKEYGVNSLQNLSFTRIASYHEDKKGVQTSDLAKL